MTAEFSKDFSEMFVYWAKTDFNDARNFPGMFAAVKEAGLCGVTDAGEPFITQAGYQWLKRHYEQQAEAAAAQITNRT